MFAAFVFLVYSMNFLILNGVLLHAPSVFRSDESHMHKYSAVLATTEPLRLQTQVKLNKNLGFFQNVVHRWKGSPIIGQFSPLRIQNRNINSACTNYEFGVEKTLRAYDLNTHDFNTISHQLNEQPELRRKMLLQAYYYKIAADLEGNLERPLPVIHSLVSSRPSTQGVTDPPFDHLPRSGSRLSLFAQSLRAIESERLRQRAQVMNELQVQDLPIGISDPNLQAALVPAVRNAVERFPHTASKIISSHGMFVEEFNILSRRHEWDPLLRWRVRRELRKMEKKPK